MPFTPHARKALELSRSEAAQLGDSDVGTGHILLGLLREGEGRGVQVLVRLGADLTQVRREVIRVVQGNQGNDGVA